MLERGRIKWFNNRAGWGFIARENAPDVFLRHDRLQGDGFKALHVGQWLEFTARKGRRGFYAVDARLLSPAEVDEAATIDALPDRVHEKAS